MRSKPDNRKDNVERIKRNIDSTLQNIELADEMIAKTSDDKTKKDLSEKNKRREKALGGMRHEIRDEAVDREKGYK